MEAIKRIRVELFEVRQSEFAAIAGVSQGTVSRWESGEIVPRLDEIKRLREAAIERGLGWDDAALFGPQREPASAAE